MAQADASSSKKDETFTLTVTTNTGLNLHYNVCASLVPVFIYLFLDGNSSNFQETTIKFYNTVVKLLKDMVDPKLTKERVINDHHAHFRKVVADNLKLPIHDPDQVEVLNNALLDMKLSVCLVRIFFFIDIGLLVFFKNCFILYFDFSASIKSEHCAVYSPKTSLQKN